MKYSNYNYFLKQENNFVGINFISELIFCLNNENYNKILNSKNDPQTIKKNDPHLFSLLKKLGVIIEENTDEKIIVKSKYNLTVFNDNSYRLTINPTLDCNLSCWYCYETHSKEQISSTTIERIIKHVKYVIETKGIRNFNLDWFGGEPTLYFEEVIYPVSSIIQEICRANNATFSNSITTNGYLIKQEWLKKIKEIKLFTFQITLDGAKENHDKVKITRDHKGTFDKIVSNINLLCSSIENVNLCLRINYQKNCHEGLEDIINCFPESNRSKIKLLIQQIWQTEDEEGVISFDNLYSVFETKGIAKISNQSFKGYRCYADKFNQAVVNTDGAVFKCTAVDFLNEKPDGLLLENGQIKWDLKLLGERFGQAPIDSEMCTNCEFLPLCLGPCSQKMIRSGLKNLDQQYCLKLGVKEALDERLSKYYSEIKGKS